MVEYRHNAHATFDLKYHVIWITKYRYKVLRGRIAERARDLIRQACHARGVEIVRGAVSPDHIHMLLSAPLQLSPANLVQYIKGRSSRPPSLKPALSRDPLRRLEPRPSTFSRMVNLPALAGSRLNRTLFL